MRKKSFNRISILIMLSAFCLHSGFAREASDSVILSALHDELYRNFTNLHAEGFDKPFFIAYTLADAKITYSSATLGALNNSGERTYKDWNVRLMVGDYNINDENFSGSQSDETAYLGSIDMPVDADYYGIRRSLWLTTNRVYNSAARIYKDKIALIEHKQLKNSDLEIPDFSRAPVIQHKETATKIPFSKEELDSLTRELSAVFKNFPDVYVSGVNSRVFESTVFFVNSEGTKVQYPFNITTLTISAATLADDSQKIRRQIGYTVRNPYELPDLNLIKEDIHTLLDNLLNLKKTERFDDEYSGPVLLIGDIVAQNFSRSLFYGSSNLIASRESLQSSSQMNMYYEKSSNSLDSKIGKIVISKNLSITAEPHRKKYKGIPLLGSFSIDAEGVIPPDELVLVDSGRLINLLNGRTPTRNIPESNGHMRFNYGYGGLSKQVGPGIIRVTSLETSPIDSLKQLLINKAKEDGHDYAIIIRSVDISGSMKPYEVYKVSTYTGEEELIRSVRLHSPGLKALKSVLGVSDNELVYNALLSGNGGNGQGGIPVSFIVPDAILLEDFEMESYRKPLTTNLPIVKNPVGNGDMEKTTSHQTSTE